MVARKKRGRYEYAYWYEKVPVIKGGQQLRDAKGRALWKRRKVWKALGRNKAAADIAFGNLAERLQARKYGRQPDPGKQSWAGFCAEYLEWAENNKVPESVLRDREVIRLFNEFFPGVASLLDLTPKLGEDYKGRRRAMQVKRRLWQHKHRKYEVHSVQNSTINRDLGTLQSMMSKAVEWKYLSENPWANVKKYDLDQRKPPQHSEKAVAAIMAACCDTFERVEMGLAYRQGLRRGEISNLEWAGDIFFDRNLIRVVATMGRRNKTKRERWLPMHPDVRRDLLTLRRESPKAVRVLEIMGEPADRDYLSKIARRVFNRAGIEGHLHIGRHTFADRVKGITDLKTLQDLLGHSRLSTTEIYLDSSEDDKRKAVAQMPRLGRKLVDK